LREGVWIVKYRGNDFDLEDFVHKNWRELSHPDVFHEISVVIGRREALD